MLCIRGRIAERNVDTLRSLLQQEPRVVAIDLKDVLIVCREAIECLGLREKGGIELRNCPTYIREWVTRATAERNGFEKRTIRREEREDVY